MLVVPGAKLGPYKILAQVGAGGMGEVYGARDSRVDRDVAIKVSTQQFNERFQREAKAIAALNHPNICTLFDIATSPDGLGYLVMELVEGPTLAERIKQGPLSLEEAWAVARQICAALDEAHSKSVVHRDLKPGNIKLKPDGTVKVLDFGLAKIGAIQGTPGEDTPTLTTLTEGMIVGTAAYMAPEQAMGKPLDKRADIWAFGVVLYEMLVGERPLRGGSVSEVLAAVIKEQPDFTRVPAPARPLIEACLQKDPSKRLRDIGDAERLLEAAGAPAEVSSGPRTRNNLPWALAAALLLVAAGTSLALWRATRATERPLLRFNVDLGPDALAGDGRTVAISPDGTRIALFMRGPGGRQMLATKLLDQATASLLPNTDNAGYPFFSPDGRWIGFFADGKLKKIPALGGTVFTLCDAPSGRGASWSEDGKIIASLNTVTGSGLSLVTEEGGVPQPLTKPTERGENFDRWPQVLPGASAVLFASHSKGPTWDDANIEVRSLKSNQIKILLHGGYAPAFVPTDVSSPSRAGRLIYIRDGVLYGVQFDPVNLEIHGGSVPLLEDVGISATVGAGQFDVSRTGTMVYLPGKSSIPGWPVVWLDSSGKTQPLLAKSGVYNTPRFSPDGNRLALAVSMGKSEDLYVYDRRNDNMARLTFTGLSNGSPTWTSDGAHIAFTGSDGLWWVRADGAGEPQRLIQTKNPVFANSISPDNKWLSYAETAPDTQTDVWMLPLDLSDPERPKPGRAEPFLHTPANEAFGTFSPDGRWVAYTSDESGILEVYVRPFPGPGGRWQVSTGGGTVPVWSSNGRELFYATPDQKFMVAQYTAKGGSFSYMKPRPWSGTPVYSAAGRRFFDLAPDGKHFAVFQRAVGTEEKQGNVHVTFLLNFFDEVRRRVR